MGMKQFVTAAKESQDPTPELKFEVDGEEFISYPPTEEQLVFMIAAQADGYTTQNEQVAATINFFTNLLDSDSHTRLVRRLLDRNDPFKFEQMMEILEYLIGEWSENPTKSSTGSTSSQVSTGKSSPEIAPSPDATPSDSGQLVSVP
jgi:hypothetical protein